MPCHLELTIDAKDQLAKLDKSIAQRILDKLRWLSDNFESASPEPLSGEWRGLHKLRIGDYRALYTFHRNEQRLTVHHIGHRSRVYKKR